MQISDADFDALVDRALDEIPQELASLVTNLAVLVQDEPPEDDPDLLGLYDGVALTDRLANETLEPDRIYLFRGPLTRMCATPEELAHEVRVTVVHEVGHHFGLDDDRLQDLGYA